MGERNAAKRQLGTKMSGLGVPWPCMAVRCPPPPPPIVVRSVSRRGAVLLLILCGSYSLIVFVLIF